MTDKRRDGERSTEIIGSRGQRGAPVDLDKVMTAVRSVVAGRLVIVDGPGKGSSVQVFGGSNSIGRGAEDNVVVLDFGDAAIHRETHAYMFIDRRSCRLSDNGKPNPVRVNGKVIMGFVPINPTDVIEIGKTTLRFEWA